MSNYEPLIRDNLKAAFSDGAGPLSERLQADPQKGGVTLRAFGEACRISPEAVFLGDRIETGPAGLVVSLYAVHAVPEAVRLEPLVSFRDLPDSMPYRGAFSANAERPLVPRVPAVQTDRRRIRDVLGGRAEPPAGTPGDFSLLLFPLPKVALCYIFFLPDEEFPASATCLFANNANRFMPLDGLADTAEYTTRKILHLVSGNGT